jgi:hypothetical protein
MGLSLVKFDCGHYKRWVTQSNTNPSSYLKRSQFRSRSQEPKPPILTLKTREPANTGKYKPDHQTPVHERLSLQSKLYNKLNLHLGNTDQNMPSSDIWKFSAFNHSLVLEGFHSFSMAFPNWPYPQANVSTSGNFQRFFLNLCWNLSNFNFQRSFKLPP